MKHKSVNRFVHIQVCIFLLFACIYVIEYSQVIIFGILDSRVSIPWRARPPPPGLMATFMIDQIFLRSCCMFPKNIESKKNSFRSGMLGKDCPTRYTWRSKIPHLPPPPLLIGRGFYQNLLGHQACLERTVHAIRYTERFKIPPPPHF